jgi:hypothetical protein
VVSVQSYGLCGDGLDPSFAVQAVISSYFNLYWPPGVYNMNIAATISSSSSFNWLISSGAILNFSQITISSASTVIIKGNGTWLQNTGGQPTYSAYLLSVFNCVNVSITGIKFISLIDAGYTSVFRGVLYVTFPYNGNLFMNNVNATEFSTIAYVRITGPPVHTGTISFVNCTFGRAVRNYDSPLLNINPETQLGGTVNQVLLLNNYFSLDLTAAQYENMHVQSALTHFINMTNCYLSGGVFGISSGAADSNSSLYVSNSYFTNQTGSCFELNNFNLVLLQSNNFLNDINPIPFGANNWQYGNVVFGKYLNQLFLFNNTINYMSNPIWDFQPSNFTELAYNSFSNCPGSSVAIGTSLAYKYTGNTVTNCGFTVPNQSYP